MHMVIRSIVYSRNRKEALNKAKNIFNNLVENGHFDYYTTFDEESLVSGKNRWGNLPVVTLAS